MANQSKLIKPTDTIVCTICTKHIRRSQLRQHLRSRHGVRYQVQEDHYFIAYHPWTSVPEIPSKCSSLLSLEHTRARSRVIQTRGYFGVSFEFELLDFSYQSKFKLKIPVAVRLN